jgi:hypothetical protein
MEIEKYEENLEKEKQAKLATERTNILFELESPVAGLNL